MDDSVAEYFLKYIRMHNGVIVITRCILMELASQSGYLNPEYVQYMRTINTYGIDIWVIYEEDLAAIMEVCFNTNAAINSYLIWAVRMLKGPISTITVTLTQNPILKDAVLKEKGSQTAGLYRRFFKAVRDNKESGDNLGEELLAICLHILSHIPGEPDGKFCIVTDDKGAGGKIDALFKKTALQYRGKKIIIFSTPKLVQVLYNEHILNDREHIKKILSAGHQGDITVLGTRIYDLKSDVITMSSDTLTDLIMTPNGINITF